MWQILEEVVVVRGGGGRQSHIGEFKSIHDLVFSSVLPHLGELRLVRWSERSKRTHTCVRQMGGLLTHVVQPAERNGTPQYVCGSIRQDSLIRSSRLYAV